MKTKRFISLTIIITIIVLLTSLLAYNSMLPKLTLATYSETINLNSQYQAIKYSATFLNKDISSDVVTIGTIDTSKVGTYPITYLLTIGDFKIHKTLLVYVKDIEPPVITLNNIDNNNVCNINNFQEPGYTAIDNVDGDITSKVKVTKEDNKVIYEVADSSGNISHAVRNISLEDNIPPLITLNGNSTIYVPINTDYVEEGAKAIDNCDGDITNNIITTGTVDASKLATYNINYSITDSNNNTASITRNVVVYDNSQDPNPQGTIYLTFDDGPGAYTNSILDILAKYNIKATFFVTNAGNDDIILREYQEGHTIGLHSATHQWSIYSSVDTYFNDLYNVSDRVKRITGLDSKYVRFPGGSSNTISRHYSKGIMTKLAAELTNRGYTYFDWNVFVQDAGECAKRGIDDRSACVLDYFEKGISLDRANIVLMHDIKSYTADALESMIQYALSQNYTFSQITAETKPFHQKIAN